MNFLVINISNWECISVLIRPTQFLKVLDRKNPSVFLLFLPLQGVHRVDFPLPESGTEWGSPERDDQRTQITLLAMSSKITELVLCSFSMAQNNYVLIQQDFITGTGIRDMSTFHSGFASCEYQEIAFVLNCSPKTRGPVGTRLLLRSICFVCCNWDIGVYSRAYR